MCELSNGGLVILLPGQNEDAEKFGLQWTGLGEFLSNFYFFKKCEFLHRHMAQKTLYFVQNATFCFIFLSFFFSFFCYIEFSLSAQKQGVFWAGDAVADNIEQQF